MSFFIRNKNSGPMINGARKRRRGLVVSADSKSKKKRAKEEVIPSDDEEIPSDDEDEQFGEKVEETETLEEEETAQERKLRLAKKYLEEIEREQRQRLEHSDQEVDDEAVLGRLRNDVLAEAGRLKRTVVDHIRESIDVTQDVTVLRCKEHRLPLTCVVVSSDSMYAYTASKDCYIVKWLLSDCKKIGQIPPRHKDKNNTNLHSSPVLSLALSSDSKHLASGDGGPLIRVWSGESLEWLFNLTGHRSGVSGLAFCPRTHNLFSCSSDKTVRVWSVVDRAYIETLFGHQAPISSIDVLSEDKAVTAGGIDNTLRVWKIKEESQLIFNGKSRHIDLVRALNESRFVSGGEDGTVSLWGVSRKKPLWITLSAHGNDIACGEPRWIAALATLRNTEMFCTGSCDGTAKVWACTDNCKSAKLHLEIPICGFINGLAFTPDEKRLLIAVGQEHRLGRWSRIKEAKNSLVIVNIAK